MSFDVFSVTNSVCAISCLCGPMPRSPRAADSIGYGGLPAPAAGIQRSHDLCGRCSRESLALGHTVSFPAASAQAERDVLRAISRYYVHFGDLLDRAEHPRAMLEPVRQRSGHDALAVVATAGGEA